MMMKIFGAALIISGGYLLGRIRINRQNKRIFVLKRIKEEMDGYEKALSEFRLSPEEHFDEISVLGAYFLKKKPIEGISKEDGERLLTLLCKIKRDGYRDSISQLREYLSDLSVLIKTLEEEAATTGKALPLVAGTIGFLVAVFLF